jgi:hypothetical protein
MTLWRLPRELRDLVYDFLLDEVDASTRPHLMAGVCISPAIPSNATLVSRRMRDEIHSSWTKLSKITVVGREELCVHALESLACGQFIWKLARNLKIDMTSPRSVPLIGWSESGGDSTNNLVQMRALQLLSMCLTMPRLENIRMQITTANTRQTLQRVDSCIADNLGLLAQQESVSRTYDRWHQAVRMETRFSWIRTPDVVCNGTLVHLVTERKLAPGVTSL